MAGLQYPLVDDPDILRQHIIFQAYKVTPPGAQISGSFLANVFTSLDFTESEAVREQAIGDISFKNTDAKLSPLKTKPIPGESVKLHMQVPFEVADGFQYDNTSQLGIAGAATLGAMNAGMGTMAALQEGISSMGQSVLDLFEGRTGDAARLAISRASQFIPVDGIRNAVRLATRVTVNPNVRTTFNGVTVREFAFSFKFIPKSAQESRQVKSIIKFFRKHAYPETIEIGGVRAGYRYPNMFKIKLKSGIGGMFKNIGTPIKMSFLRSVRTSYNPTLQTFHADGSPSEIDLNLAFTEYKTLDRSDVLNEDNESFYDMINKRPTFKSREEAAPFRARTGGAP